MLHLLAHGRPVVTRHCVPHQRLFPHTHERLHRCAVDQGEVTTGPRPVSKWTAANIEDEAKLEAEGCRDRTWK